MPKHSPRPASAAKSFTKRRKPAAPLVHPLIDRVNALPLSDFQSRYGAVLSADSTFPPSASCPSVLHQKYSVTLYDTYTLSAVDLVACCKVIELTSRAAYEASSVGWSRRKKMVEMTEKGMKYLIVRRVDQSQGVANGEGDAAVKSKCRGEGNGSSAKDALEYADEEGKLEQKGNEPPNTAVAVEAFLSFLPTLSDLGHPAIYCYEIHILPYLRGLGLGMHLMRIFETIGRAIGVTKAMLTVFRCNELGVKFYRTLGYAIDEESPAESKLRGGKTRRSDYLILSNTLS